MSCNSHSTFQSNADLFLPKWYSHLDVSSFIHSLTLSQLLRWLSGCFFSAPLPVVRRLQVQWRQTSNVSPGWTAPRFISVCCPCACQAAGIVTCQVQQWPPHSALVAIMLVLLSPDPNLSAAAHLESEPLQHYGQNMTEKNIHIYDDKPEFLRRDLTLVRPVCQTQERSDCRSSWMQFCFVGN